MSCETNSQVNGSDRSASRWLPTEDEVIEATVRKIQLCRDTPSLPNLRGFRLDAPSDSSPPVWVKYTSQPEFLFTEMKTQQYVHAEWMKADEETKARLLVPEVFDYFEDELDNGPWGSLTYGFIVMEYLPGISIRNLIRPLRRDRVPESDERITSLKDRVVEAVCFLLSLSPPPETAPGPVGGGRMKCRAFGTDDLEAPRQFESSEDLQTYINDEIEQEGQGLAPCDFLTEDLRLCCCDLGFHNFILQDESNPQTSKLIIIDFEMTNWLPHSFLVWESWNTRDRHMSTGIRDRGQLEINEDNIQAINGLRNRMDRIEHEYWVNRSREFWAKREGGHHKE
ncbi:hypothetical protein F5Y03DRAFT_363697 [Xylaria venustula]|nr:hypothetical protein F5Y03DRAFT_363697 [Xylaria venustula]